MNRLNKLPELRWFSLCVFSNKFTYVPSELVRCILLEKVARVLNFVNSSVRVDILPPAQDKFREHRVKHPPDDQRWRICEQG